MRTPGVIGKLAPVEPVLPVVRRPDQPLVRVLVAGRGRRVLGPRQRDEESVLLGHQRSGDRTRSFEADPHVRRQPQLRLDAVPVRNRRVVGVAVVLPLGANATVVEGRLAVHVHLHLAVHAANETQQDMVGVVVGRRAAVGLRTALLVVPRPDQEDVADDDPTAARPPARLEHHRPRQVPAGGRDRDTVGPDPEPARVAVEDRAEHAGGVEPWQAQPLHVATRRNKGAGGAVGQEGKVRDRRERVRPRAAVPDSAFPDHPRSLFQGLQRTAATCVRPLTAPRLRRVRRPRGEARRRFAQREPGARAARPVRGRGAGRAPTDPTHV